MPHEPDKLIGDHVGSKSKLGTLRGIPMRFMQVLNVFLHLIGPLVCLAILPGLMIPLLHRILGGLNTSQGLRILSQSSASLIFPAAFASNTNNKSKTTTVSMIVTNDLPKMNFHLKPEEYLEGVKEAIAHGKETLESLAAIPVDKCNFANILEPLAKLESDFRMKTMVASFLQYVSPDAALRDVSVEASKLIDDYEIEKAMHEGVFKVVEAVATKKESLEGEPKRLLEKVQLGYRRNGLALSKENREKLKEKRKRLAEVELEFNKNMNEENSRIIFTKADLEGCADDFLEGLEKGIEPDTFILTMKYPEVNGVMRMARKRESREKMYKAFNSRCPQNLVLLEEAVKLRQEAAVLLGYHNHAEFQLQERLAKNPANVTKFQDGLRGKLVELGKKELKHLADIKKKDSEEGAFDSIDFAYYNRLLTMTEYSVDFEKVKEYFSMEKVVEEMLKIYQEVLGLVFEKLEGISGKTWHEDVQIIRVRDKETGELMGHVYLDLFPRPGKYSHAACFPLQPGYMMANGQYEKPAQAIVANFSKPGVNKPSLLRFDEVVTLLHELGHAMHGICSVTRYSRFQGTSVETDFVEAPSQMLENWCWDERTLERLSEHFQTREKMPQELIQKVVATRRINAGLLYLRQLFFGLFDMGLHTGKTVDDINKLYRTLKAEITLLLDPEGLCPAASFGHLMGGYDAGYYGYLWSEVFSSDMFYTRFAREGLQNPKTGLDYRREILRPGGSRDGMESLKGFLGREPNQEAFLKSIGIDH